MKIERMMIVISALLLIAAVQMGLRTVKELNGMTETVTQLQLDKRVLAYHQAIAQLEQQYPLPHRDRFGASEWEHMIIDKTDMILAAFYEGRQ